MSRAGSSGSGSSRAPAAPAASSPGSRGLETALRSHYDARALERNGLCASPELGVVTASRVEEQTQERLVVRVSYSYRDPDARLPAQCRGFGTRLFTSPRAPRASRSSR